MRTWFLWLTPGHLNWATSDSGYKMLKEHRCAGENGKPVKIGVMTYISRKPIFSRLCITMVPFQDWGDAERTCITGFSWGCFFSLGSDRAYIIFVLYIVYANLINIQYIVSAYQIVFLSLSVNNSLPLVYTDIYSV